MRQPTLVEQTLSIDFPGHDLDSACSEASSRMQKAHERILHLEEERRRIQYQIDHAERDFEQAREAQQMFHKEIERQEQEECSKCFKDHEPENCPNKGIGYE